MQQGEHGKIIFVTGIDTGIGKTYATAYYAHLLRKKGLKVITQKPVQTGCIDISEDLEAHDRLPLEAPSVESSLQPHRCSYLFPFSASPHLSAAMAGVTIDPQKIVEDGRQLLQGGYNIVLMEGAGGLMVPLTKHYLTADFIAEQGYSVCLVTCGRLGSLNHTLLSLEALEYRNITVQALLYNLYPGAEPEIEAETRDYLQGYLEKKHPDCQWVDIPRLGNVEHFI